MKKVLFVMAEYPDWRQEFLRNICRQQTKPMQKNMGLSTWR